MTHPTQDIRERARKDFGEILRGLGAWSDCNGRKCGKCWADNNFIDNIITKAQKEERERAFRIIHEHVMGTTSLELINALEAVQQEILDMNDLTKRT